ncbi:hypothetical protein LCGC14_2196490 [marine sediment metagenome]|uniref:Uncharacterized protein n=1 Tax=marine sediment metagenome TaxID=412755 RepID=A0A0F9DI66_9ZZZZ
MQTKDKVEFIRQQAIKANPEIVELKFGCEVIIKDGKNGKIIYESDTGTLVIAGRELPITFKGSVTEIIGRPIRLADVLYAIKEKQKLYHKDLIGLIEDKMINVMLSWNLKDDNLENQYEETIDFIYKILKHHD